VPIIIAYNTYKDSINTLGSQRFAAETAQTLTDFFSDDKIVVPNSDKTKKRKTAESHKFLPYPMMYKGYCGTHLIVPSLTLLPESFPYVLMI